MLQFNNIGALCNILQPKLIVLTSVLCLALFASAQTPNKVALIVAISKYGPNTGWGDLSSAEDVRLITESLKAQGFKQENISVLKDKAATAKGIMAAIKSALIDKVKKGDVAIFHYSGHGQQIEDLDGDEGDGLDEALVPYDAPMEYQPGVNKHLSDDSLGARLADVRQALGPTGNLLVIIDACHSGTATRGGGTTRGTTRVYAPVNKTTTNKIKTIKENFGVARFSEQLAPMACFFASSPFELNAEATLPDGVGCGSLSLAFSKALARMKSKGSYGALFEDIKIEMSSLVPNQTPMAEGDLNYPAFGGNVLPKPHYYLFDIREKNLLIPVGTLAGVFEGSTVNVYAPDTRDTTSVKPWATGTITAAGTHLSTIILNNELSAEQLRKGWVYLDAINYGDLTVKIKVNGSDEAFKNTIEKIIDNIKQAKKVNGAADLFIESDGSKFLAEYIYITTAAGVIIDSIAKNKQDSLSTFFTQRIGNYARASYLRNMNLKNDNYNISFEFVPLRCIKNCGQPNAEYVNEDIKTRKDTSGNIVFKYGERFRINITNKGNSVAYYTVLDIQPDNIINVLIPGRGEQAEEFKVFPETTITLTKIFKVGPPSGVDVIKIIGSDAPVDLRPMVTTRGAVTRGAPLSPFAKLMQGTYTLESGKKRGPDEETIQPNAVNIITIPYKIVAN